MSLGVSDLCDSLTLRVRISLQGLARPVPRAKFLRFGVLTRNSDTGISATLGCMNRSLHLSFTSSTFVGVYPLMDELYAFFMRRPIYQRAFLAFTTGLFLACAAAVSAAQ